MLVQTTGSSSVNLRVLVLSRHGSPHMLAGVSKTSKYKGSVELIDSRVRNLPKKLFIKQQHDYKSSRPITRHQDPEGWFLSSLHKLADGGCDLHILYSQGVHVQSFYGINVQCIMLSEIYIFIFRNKQCDGCV